MLATLGDNVVCWTFVAAFMQNCSLVLETFVPPSSERALMQQGLGGLQERIKTWAAMQNVHDHMKSIEASVTSATKRTRELSRGCEQLRRLTQRVTSAEESDCLRDLSESLASKVAEQAAVIAGVNRLLTSSQEECDELRSRLQVRMSFTARPADPRATRFLAYT
jgi:uncharacterized coiled-coil protein SlyX